VRDELTQQMRSAKVACAIVGAVVTELSYDGVIRRAPVLYVGVSRRGASVLYVGVSRRAPAV